jgi:carboxyl-terminal processing protease
MSILKIHFIKKINFKKIGKVSIIVLVGLVVLAGVFWAGIRVGERYYPSIKLVKGLKNLETTKPADVDFNLFWDAWRLIQSDYLKSGKLDSQKMVYGAVRGLLSSLGDPYSVFFDPEEAKKFSEDVSGNFSGIGIELGVKKGVLTVISPIEDTPAWEAGLKAGDQILKINDTETTDMTSEEAVKLIRGPENTEVILTIFRKDFEKPKEFKIKRAVISVSSVKVSFLGDNNIAHIKLSSFNENTSYEFYRASLEALMKQSPAIILDLRNNPGGYLEVSVDIAGWFLNRGDVVVRENIKNEKETIFRASGNQALINMPVIILANEGSASASEILAGALRDDRNIKIVGEKTFGKGSVQEIETLAGDSMIKLTVAEWLTPSGVSLNDNGLEPDYKVEMTDSDYQNNKDPQLDKALEVIESQITAQ